MSEGTDKTGPIGKLNSQRFRRQEYLGDKTEPTEKFNGLG